MRIAWHHRAEKGVVLDTSTQLICLEKLEGGMECIILLWGSVLFDAALDLFRCLLKANLFTLFQVSKEGDTFEVPVEIAKLSNLVVTTLGDEPEEDDMVEIPLPNVKATVLAKVIEYCTHYKQVEPSECTV